MVVSSPQTSIPGSRRSTWSAHALSLPLLHDNRNRFMAGFYPAGITRSRAAPATDAASCYAGCVRVLLTVLLPLLSAPIPLAASRISPANASPRPVIVGYVFPDGAALKPGQIQASAMTRINYAFANIKD